MMSAVYSCFHRLVPFWFVTVANRGPDRQRAGDDAESYLVVALDIVQGHGADVGQEMAPT
jgi:hypothetical protein